MEGEDPQATWFPLYARGIAKERSGQFDSAEMDDPKRDVYARELNQVVDIFGPPSHHLNIIYPLGSDQTHKGSETA